MTDKPLYIPRNKRKKVTITKDESDGLLRLVTILRIGLLIRQLNILFPTTLGIAIFIFVINIIIFLFLVHRESKLRKPEDAIQTPISGIALLIFIIISSFNVNSVMYEEMSCNNRAFQHTGIVIDYSTKTFDVNEQGA